MYVYHGRQRLKQAVEMHSSNRKVKTWIMAILNHTHTHICEE